MKLLGRKSAICFVFAAVASSALCGCRWQIGKTPVPFPTPTPTPTPTPITLAAQAAATSTENSPSAPQSMSARVASSVARYFAVATSEASSDASDFSRALSSGQDDATELAAALGQAREALARLRAAYRKAEPAIFFVDPESEDELRAQPDPFGSGSPSGDDGTMAGLDAVLGRLENLLDEPLDASAAGTLLVEAKSAAASIEKIQAGIDAMASAWTPESGGNFRSDFFLPSPEQAVARIFQGLLAVTGDLLPSALVADPADSPRGDLALRLAAVREIYAGTEDENGDAVSLHELVRQVSPVQAALTRASIVRATALATLLEIAPEGGAPESELLPALDDVTRQLTFSARALGIVITDDATQK